MPEHTTYREAPERDPLCHQFVDGMCKYCGTEITDERYGQFCDVRFAAVNERIRLADVAIQENVQKLLSNKNGASFMMAGVENMTDTENELCEHDCKCGKVWSHGLASKCRVPREFSPCPDCLTSTVPIPSKKELKDQNMNWEVQIRNDEMWNPHNLTVPVGGVANMSSEQIAEHIAKLEDVIRELRIRALTARGKKVEKDEESLQKLTAEEREGFLRVRDSKKSSKIKVEGASKAGRDIERAIQSFVKLGMSRDMAEKMAKGDD